MLEVLRYLHNLKPPVVHRDIKPANIIRADDGTIALVDFGGVRAAVRDKGGSTVVGTFGYMAPNNFTVRRPPPLIYTALVPRLSRWRAASNQRTCRGAACV